jgi:hypothetical protein
MKKALIFAALIAAASGAANADPRDDALSAMLRCSGLSDRNARLGCYDATISRAPGAMNQPAPPRAAAPAYAAPQAAYIPPPAAPVAARRRSELGMLENFLGSGPVRGPQTTVAQFGSESIANGGTHAIPAARDGDSIDQISARVIAYRFDAGYVTVSLDNGQVWRQTPSGTALGHLSKPPLAYSAVINRDGPYGSYGLKLSGVAQLIGVRRIR